MPYADFQLLVTNLVRDDGAVIDQAARDNAIDIAALRYSTDRPQLKVADVAAAGGHTLALPVGWEPLFSELIAAEYPIGANPPSYIERESFRLYLKTDGTYEIRFDNSLPVGNVRLTFTIKQSLTAGAPGTDTVPIVDREAVCKYAASLLCDQLAAQYSNRTSSSIQADAVSYQTQAADYRRQASGYRAQYLAHLGIDEKKSNPASASATVSLKDSLGNERFFHSRYTRLAR
jgi:hypothetical protein